MEDYQEEHIEISESDLALLTSESGISWLESLWLCEATYQEAFQALCSILTRGKGLCSPTKRHKRKANEVYFASLAGMKLDSPASKAKLVAGKTKVGLLALANGLAGQSERWASMTADEILSVVIVVDLEGTGSFTWTQFYNFCNLLDSRMDTKIGVNTPSVAIAQLYADLVAERQVRRTSTFINSTKGTLTEERLAGLTAKLIKVAICARLNGLNPLTLLMNIKAHERLAAIRRRKEKKKQTEKASSSAMSSPSKEGGSPKTTKHNAQQCTQQTPTNRSSATEGIIAPAKSNFSLDSLKTLLRHLGADIASVNDGSIEVNLARVNVQEKLAVASSSSALDNSVGDLSLSRISIDNSILETPSGANGAEGSADGLDASIAKLRENASVISAKLASQAKDVDNTMNIWSALQRLEVELQKASSATSSPSSPRQGQVDGAASPQTVTKGKALFSTPSTASPACTASNSSGMTGRKSISGIKVNNLTISTAAENQARSVLSCSINGSMQEHVSGKALQQISPISAAIHSQKTNMSIFKSPAQRSKHVHRNLYCEETMSWESDKSLLTNRYNERFQTVHDTENAKKIFRVLGLTSTDENKDSQSTKIH